MGDACSCLKSEDECIKKFVFFGDSDAHVSMCLPYSGLENSADFRGDKVCHNVSVTSAPYPYCEPNVYNTGASYKGSVDKNISCMTPYQFLTNRNYKLEWKPSFVVVASSVWRWS